MPLLVLAVLLVLVLVLVLIAGVVAGVVLVVRLGRRAAPGVLEADPTTPRISCEVHAGAEQVLIHLARSLSLPTGRDDAGYGQVYLAASVDTTMRLASRSEIGRGFDGEIRVHRTRRCTEVEYFILRLPGDDAVLRAVAALDDRLVAALRALDPEARVRRGR